ncbi:MAG TPA: prepilin-type N-terminal cleavage/methylation domain-containing protein [Syntrophorhabdaceae bacterium]
MKLYNPSHNTNRRPAEEGFTLLEVLVALAILGMAVTVVFQLFAADLRAVRASEDYVAASIRAQARLREIVDDETLTEKAWSETTTEGYRVDVVVAPALPERTKDLQVQLLDVMLTIYWVKDSRTKVMTMRTIKMIPKKVT